MKLLKSKNFENLSALAVIQGGNAIIPLLVFPFILGTIGAAKFATIATLEGISFILLTFALYSFDVSGIKNIKIAEKNGKTPLSKIYYAILYIRLIILILCSLLYLGLIAIFKKELLLPALVWTMFPLGVVLQSSYFYQATSNNTPLSVFVLIPRVLASILALLFINENSSVIFASIFLSASYFLSGILSFLYLKKNIGFIYPNSVRRRAQSIFHRGRSLFLGGLSVILYRGSNTILLAALGATPAGISAYAIAEKYIKMLQAIVMPVTQIYTVKLINELLEHKSKRHSPWKVIWKNTKHQILIVSTLVFVFAIFVTSAQSKINWLIAENSIILMAIMTPAAIFGVLNYMYGTITFTTLSIEPLYAKIVFLSGLMAVIISTLLINMYSEAGAAVSFALAELVLLLFLLLGLKLKLTTIQK